MGRSHTRSSGISIIRVDSQELPLLQSLSVSCFCVILGLPGPHFPSAVLTAPLERSTCPYQRSLFSFRMRSRSSMPSHPNSSLDLLVTLSCGLIIALSFLCRRWRFGFVNGQVSLAWRFGLHTQELYMQPCVLKERTSSSSLNYFQAVFICVVVESSQPLCWEHVS